MSIELVTIETPSLGDRSYLAHDGTVAVVIDPQRDIDRVLAVADEQRVRIGMVLETHVHNDYVSGGPALARRCRATYALAGSEDVSVEHRPVDPGDRLEVGAMTVEVLATPGHTPYHLAYVLTDELARPVGAFTGGSLLYGTVGRTDLVGPGETDRLTRAQWRSVRRLLQRLDERLAVYPTHGFGSFCSSSPAADRSAGTIADERSENVVTRFDDETDFVAYLLAGLTDHPSYYAHMGLLNRAGAFEPDLSAPVVLAPDEVRRRADAGEWVVDLRPRRAFASAHLTGTVSVELSDGFATWVGWLLPWGSRLTLVAPGTDDVAAAQRQLVRIGIDRPAGMRVGPVEELVGRCDPAGYAVASFAELADRRREAPGLEVLDVRRRDEFDAGHLAGAHHVPLHQLVDHLHHVPEGELWVHCASGARASIAASLLHRAGHRIVLVDDDVDRAAQWGLRSGSGP